MSKTLFSVALAALVSVLSVAVVVGEKPQKPAREALEVTRALYTIIQNDAAIGSEEIVRTEYNDNTVTFVTHHILEPAPDVTMEATVELTVVDESYFPLEYHMDKKVTQKDSGMTMGADVEMFANVAVLTTRSPTASGSRNIVLSAGTAFIETGVVYVYYPFLFWYNRDTGGRQSFDVLDVSTGRKSVVVVQHITRKTIEVDGKEYESDLYNFHRERFEVMVFVDDDGRIIRVEQNFMTFDLVEWSRLESN